MEKIPFPPFTAAVGEDEYILCPSCETYFKKEIGGKTNFCKECGPHE